MSKKINSEKIIEQIKESFNTNITHNKDKMQKFILPVVLITVIIFFVLGRYSVPIDKSIICKEEIRKIEKYKTETELLIKENILLKDQVTDVIKKRGEYTSNILSEFEKNKEEECTKKIDKIKKEYIKLKCSICP